MSAEEALTRWSVRLAMALYVLSLVLRARAADRAARSAWTAGCLALVAHIALAFHFTHHWSHAVAYEETARQTAEVVGLDWGGGIYANYAFAMVWLLDVAWWWRGLEAYRSRPRWIDWIVQGFLAFIAFNATVVFATGVVRGLGLAATLLLLVCFACRVSGPAD